jgi:hypothetical protein
MLVEIVLKKAAEETRRNKDQGASPLTPQEG